MGMICGVDGCSKGWIVLGKDLDTGCITGWLCSSARELAGLVPKPQVVTIDIPIGLPERGARDCDLAARWLLGPGRASSVFPAPIRPILGAADYAEACRIRYQIEQKKISVQTWAILPKIRDVDIHLRQDPEFRQRVHEVHPEVCFYFLGGQKAMRYKKKSESGYAERRTLLEPLFSHWLDDVLGARRQLASTRDDVLDAFAALWTAERIVTGEAQTIPADPPVDAWGLQMEMVA